MELVTFNNQTLLDQRAERLQALEADLFRLREAAENIWLEIGRICSEIIEYKLYKHAVDEDGNYFRTWKAYLEYLDQQFEQRGWKARPATLNRWVGQYRLFVDKLGFELEDVAKLGVKNLMTLAPAVTQLEKEGRIEEAKDLVSEFVEVAKAHGGVPNREVLSAVDFLTGRVEKGLEVTFKKALFGRQLTTFRLWWGGRPIDLLNKQQITDEQYEWVMRRTGQRLDE